MFARSDNRYAVLAHQSAYTTVPDIQANLLEFFCHPGTTITAQTETRLFSYMRQRDQIRPLPAAGRTAAERPQTTTADSHNTTHQINGKCRSVFFDELKPHSFWLAKNTVAFIGQMIPRIIS